MIDMNRVRLNDVLITGRGSVQVEGIHVEFMFNKLIFTIYHNQMLFSFTRHGRSLDGEKWNVLSVLRKGKVVMKVGKT